MSAIHPTGRHGPRIALAVAALCISGGVSAQAVAPNPTTPAAREAAPAAARLQAAPAAPAARRARKDARTGEFFDGPVEVPGATMDGAAEPGIVGDSRPEEMNELMLSFMQRRQPEPVAGARAGSGMALGADSLTASMVQCVPGESEAAHRLHAPAVNLKALREASHVK
jgi:hypothetical protein